MRHTKSLSRRAAALLLAVLLALPTVYAAAGDQKLQTTTQIVDGLTYRNTITENAGSRVESFSFELAPHSAAQPILVQGDTTIYAAASINRAISNAQAAGWHVLGGINTDFFALSTGVPLGIVVENGVYKSSNEGENTMVITDGLVSILESPKVSMTLYNPVSGFSTPVHNLNKTRHPLGGLYLLNEYFSVVSTRSDGAGWYVRMRQVADPYTGQMPELTVNAALNLEVIEVFHSDVSPVIGPNEYILTAAAEAGYEGTFESFQPGDLMTLTTACDNAVLSSAQWAGGVGDIMIRNGAVTDSTSWVYASDGRQPRTALGIKADGTLVLYAVDGRQSGYSVGLSQVNLADELLRQGCVTAVNLDGGGSTSFSLWTPGQNGPAVVNRPSDGKPRGCATYLLLVTDEKGDGWPSRLVPTQDGQVVLAGASLPLPQVQAVDTGLNPVSADLSALTYTSLNGLGTVGADSYTAGLQAGTDTLSLSADGLTGTAQLHVVDRLTELKITRAGSTSALTSLNLKAGDQVQLAASGSYWSRTALRSISDVTCTVQGNVGTIDENGLFTASRASGSGSITFSAGGLTQTVNVTMTNLHEDVPPDDWAYEAVEYCYAKGIVSGIAPNLFGRNSSITRGDFMVMLYAAAGRPEVSSPCTFTDVDPNGYQYKALSWAQANGLASGTGDGAFSPNANILREQAFTILYRFLPIAGKDCPDASLSVLDQFPDKDLISTYARNATATMVAQKLVSGGTGGIGPQRTLSRAEMAALLRSLLEHTPITDVPTDPAEPTEPSEPSEPTEPTQPVEPAEPPDPEQPENPSDPSQTVTPPSGGSWMLALDQSALTLVSGSSVALNAAILPAAEGAVITWESSDPETAPVTPAGVVTNLNPDREDKTLTVTASWNGLSASCTVTCQRASRAGTVTGADTGLNVRSGPDTSYGRSGALFNGDRVLVLGQQPGWYQILFRNPSGQAAIGYVSADYLTLD